MATVDAPDFQYRREYSQADWLWLVDNLLKSDERVRTDPWSPYANEWRSRAHALLASVSSLRPYLDRWESSDARRYEQPPPDVRSIDNDDAREAASRMVSHARGALAEDASTLRDAYTYVHDFGTPTQFVTGEPSAPLPAEWDTRPFEVDPADRPGARSLEIHPVTEQEANFAPSKPPSRHPLFSQVRFGPSKPVAASRPQPSVSTQRIFLVHGRDHAPRDAVKAFLLELGLKPVVLEDQPNQGRTLIEKFEAHTEVAYAVVLLTPEDVHLAPDGSRTRRPRQNVILELGFLMGKLGRSRVAAIVVGDSERPSDVDGLAYIPFTDGRWQVELARELRDAGVDVDMNRL